MSGNRPAAPRRSPGRAHTATLLLVSGALRACAPATPGASPLATRPAAPAPTGGAAYPVGYGPAPALPAPNTTHRVQRFATVVGWAAAERPRVPAGLRVTAFAAGLDHPRWLHALPNGDVLVAEANNSGTPPRDSGQAAALAVRRAAGNRGASADRVTLLRDTTGDGAADVRVALLTRAAGLDRPFGMAYVAGAGGDAGQLYVASTHGVHRFAYRLGASRVEGPGTLVLPLPADGYNNHWTRNVLASPDGRRLYVTVGSATNVDVERQDARDPRRAAVLELELASGRSRVFAAGLRNPNGLAWQPAGDGRGPGAPPVLWAAVNERDGLGDDLVPDYITRVRDGAFYGWPYSYFGAHEDPRKRGERPDLVRRAVAPDYAMGAHTATMAVAFYAPAAGAAAALPGRFRGGAFVTQRDSWNRGAYAGYRVAFVPFAGGRPSGPPETVVDGFLADATTGAARGRPVGLAVLPDGALLVADDAGDRVWRVEAEGGGAGAPRRVGVVEGLASPESARWDADAGVWLVSNVNGPGHARDANGFVSRVAADGRVLDRAWIRGGVRGVTLHAPTGLALQADTLWAVDVDVVRAFHRRTGAPLGHVDLAPLGALRLNDVAVGPGGALYVTDMGVRVDAAGRRTHTGPDRIFRIGDGRTANVALASPALAQPNGIAWDARHGRFLIAPVDGNALLAWRPGAAAPTLVATGAGRFDGVEVLDDGRVLVASWNDASVGVAEGGRVVPLLRDVAQPADIGLDPAARRVAVPRIRAHRLEVWQLP